MSEQLGIAKATVQSKLKELEERGFIEIENKSGLSKNGKPRTFNNHYIVHDFDVPFGVKCLTPGQAGDLLGHSTSQITEMYYVKRDNTRLVGITDSFEI